MQVGIGEWRGSQEMLGERRRIVDAEFFGSDDGDVCEVPDVDLVARWTGKRRIATPNLVEPLARKERGCEADRRLDVERGLVAKGDLRVAVRIDKHPCLRAHELLLGGRGRSDVKVSCGKSI